MVPSAVTPEKRLPAKRAGRATAGGEALPLGERLLGANLISEEQLQHALQLQSQKGMKLGEGLLEMGLLSEDELLPYIQRQMGVPAVRLREGLIDPRIVQVLPQDRAQKYKALAMFKVRDTLCVAMAEPQNLQQIDEIERITGLRVRPVFAFRLSVERMLQRCYEENFSVDTVTADLDEKAVELQADLTDVSVTSVENLVDGSPIINLVNYLILHAIRQGASDIHIEPGRKSTTVRLRVDGLLREILRPRRDIHPAIVSRIKVMGKLDIAEHRYPQDGRCQVAVEGKEVDLRISTIPTVLGEKVVMRVLDRRRLTFNLDKLGFSESILARFKRLLAKPHGLLLVTGPTGSGKTTTLYSALELINSVHRNIVTVEDPVEYQMELVNQVQVDESRELDFAAVLRSVLRQDPDVIMVGEIRDPETAQVAVQAALTGHLVLSTLHTNDSSGAVLRLVDMGVASYKVSAALVGVIAQRLIRTICPHCRTGYYPAAEELELVHYAGDRRRSFARGEGCRQCYDTGFQGRLGIYELLEVTPAMRELISSGATVDVIRKAFLESGGQPLLKQALDAVDDEQTSLDEAVRVALFE